MVVRPGLICRRQYVRFRFQTTSFRVMRAVGGVQGRRKCDVPAVDDAAYIRLPILAK